MKEKPSDDYEDPRDVAEIKYALEHMGDFKLKTAANYVVPEHLRMNTARKLVQLATLQEQVDEIFCLNFYMFIDRMINEPLPKPWRISSISA